MKWGRKKSAAPPSSSPISGITRVFPVSWFSRSKEKRGDLESKNKQFEFSTPKKSSGWREGRFYSMDEDDAFWRLSFGEDRIQGRRSTGGINPLLFDSDHDFQVPVSDFRSFDLTKVEASRREECRNFSEMVLDIKKMREKRCKQRNAAENGGKTGDGKAGVSTRRRKDLNDQVSRKWRGIDDGEEKIPTLAERDVFEIEPENIVCVKDESWKSPASKSRNQPKHTNIDLSSFSVWQDFQDMKLKDVKIKPESKKKSANSNRELHSRKTKEHNSRGIRSHSPRTECKIRALEEMKKARMKTKKKEMKQQVQEGNTVFDSFAVVKTSYDPQQDFRDSMVEMIREKGLGHPEDLEELLACYLTLNRDEYHDLIIKVFRQVWFELKGVYISPPMENAPCFDY